MQQKKNTILYQFGIILFLFELIMLIVYGFVSYHNEYETYKQERLELTRNITIYLENLIKEEPEDFVEYVSFYKAHYPDMKIDPDFTSYLNEYHVFMDEFEQAYPGMTLGQDIQISELPYEMQLDYYEYRHEYWLTVFEDLRESLGLMYVYFTVPNSDTMSVFYVCDVERSPREDDPEHMMLGDDIANPYDRFDVEWDTWNQGKNLDRFLVVDNEWGHVYTYYNPLIINRQKVGLINADIQFDAVNRAMLENTIILMLQILCIVLLSTFFLLVVLNNMFLKKIVMLTEKVKVFSDTQDPGVADIIRGNVKGNNELSRLAFQVADMITGIDKRRHELTDTHKALNEAQHEAAVASSLATKDSLTGVRNKLAYDQMCKDIDYKIADGFKDFGIVMIDLNFLKRINDTYGHDKGNIAIKMLCGIICRTFSHSPVFRIGGDEFVVILENDDYVRHEEKFLEFEGRIAELSTKEGLPIWEKISAAAGKAMFNPDIDQTMNNVFKRADKAMYENKKNMKALRQ